MVNPLHGVSEASLTSFEEMLYMTFGDDISNTVDFRVMHAILLMLARSLSLLERHVYVKMLGPDVPSTTIAINEIKVRGKGGKKKKKKSLKPSGSSESTESSQEDMKGKQDKGKKKDRQSPADEGTDATKRRGKGKLDDDEEKRGEKKDEDEDDLLTEKLLIVEFSPDGRPILPGSAQRPPMSIATKDDYNRALGQIVQLEKRYRPVAIPGFELLEAMHQQAVLSDPKSIVQLSARLECVERAISDIMQLLNQLPGSPMQGKGAMGGKGPGGQAGMIGGGTGPGSQYAQGGQGGAGGTGPGSQYAQGAQGGAGGTGPGSQYAQGGQGGAGGTGPGSQYAQGGQGGAGGTGPGSQYAQGGQGGAGGTGPGSQYAQGGQGGAGGTGPGFQYAQGGQGAFGGGAGPGSQYAQGGQGGAGGTGPGSQYAQGAQGGAGGTGPGSQYAQGGQGGAGGTGPGSQYAQGGQGGAGGTGPGSQYAQGGQGGAGGTGPGSQYAQGGQGALGGGAGPGSQYAQGGQGGAGGTGPGSQYVQGGQGAFGGGAGPGSQYAQGGQGGAGGTGPGSQYAQGGQGAFGGGAGPGSQYAQGGQGAFGGGAGPGSQYTQGGQSGAGGTGPGSQYAQGGQGAFGGGAGPGSQYAQGGQSGAGGTGPGSQYAQGGQDGAVGTGPGLEYAEGEQDGTGADADDDSLDGPKRDPLRLIEFSELRSLVTKTRETLPKICTPVAKRVENVAGDVIRKTYIFESQIKPGSDFDETFNWVEDAVTEYASTINRIDAEYNSMLATQQEELTEMEQKLEYAIDFMAEALANREPDVEGIMDINQKFNSLQTDLDNLEIIRMETVETQSDYEERLIDALKQIQHLQRVKCERDEIESALEAKVSVAVVNEKITKAFFEAIHGEFQKSIFQAYEKFNSHENRWQQTLDDLDRRCHEKCNKDLVDRVASNIVDKQAMLTDRVDFMLEVVGEPRTFDESRDLERQGVCLSCGNGPRDAEREPLAIKKKVMVEEVEDVEDEHKPICYPHMPIPHPVHPRTKTCGLYCGGRYYIPAIHKGDVQKVAEAVKIKPLKKEAILPYDVVIDVPCHPCNYRPTRRVRRKRVKIGPASDTDLGKAKSEYPFEIEEIPEEEEEESLSVESIERFEKYSKYWIHSHHGIHSHHSHHHGQRKGLMSKHVVIDPSKQILGPGKSSTTHAVKSSAHAVKSSAHGMAPSAHGMAPSAHGMTPSAHGMTPSVQALKPQSEGTVGKREKRPTITK